MPTMPPATTTPVAANSPPADPRALPQWTASAPAWVADVLHFWFDELSPATWFKPGDGLDDQIRTRFADAYAACRASSPEALLTRADDALAAILVLDQFPRNMFRGTPEAFATDPEARAVAEGAVARGLDQQVPVVRRVFFYMPFEHSESVLDQVRAVALVATLGDAEFTRFAVDHKALIDRFGRFPYRNRILGRQSTPDEEAFLATSTVSYGQSASIDG